ncbi:hypothetical protein [Streptomyces rubradiris]|uniref:Uncharacterized protein n=1 Tax=Streptomyces rubradiris TaxID=285531 RepID=A0ABQ3R8F8_STRRR|nr:hypothetical protein [Streptomyces rubradiris]GHH23157.1 hypothetical protein GCM10018792_59560 [Streptomyces rubradiris]GHI52136.1 hypothetical protein Srubr_19820 [Streptomyces rubradiris]
MATIVGAVCTPLGVAVGAVGAPAAARVRLRGAIAQADAVLAQAHTTYRAALDQAYAAQHAAHEQWRREIRRDAYAAFVTALDEVRELVARPEFLDTDPEDGSGPLQAASRAMAAALAVVELEGPASLTVLARTVQQRCLVAGEHALRLAPRATAMRLLSSATDAATADRSDNGSPSALARSAHQALTQLREAAYRHESGRIGRDAYDAARQRATEAVDVCGLFTAGQARALLSDPSWEAALRMGSEHAEALARFEAARGDFVSAARELLDPEGDTSTDRHSGRLQHRLSQLTLCKGRLELLTE